MNTRDPIVLALPTVVGVLAFSAVATAQVPIRLPLRENRWS